MMPPENAEVRGSKDDPFYIKEQAGMTPADRKRLPVLGIWLAFIMSALPTHAFAAETKPLPAIAAEDRMRVVSVGGSVSETMHALGLADRIIAVDTSSVFPESLLKDKPNVGYMRALSAEGVLSLGPSMILAVENAGPPDVIKVLEEASVPFVKIPNAATRDGVLEKIGLIADVMDVSEKGAELANAVEQEFAALADLVGSVRERKRVMFVFSLRSGRVLASGRNTAAAGILALAGADNALSGFEGYKPLSNEAIINAAPDVILMMDRNNHPIAAEDVFALPMMAATPAGRNRSFVKMDGAYLLGFGPRTATAAAELARRLYPSLSAPAEKPATSRTVN